MQHSAGRYVTSFVVEMEATPLKANGKATGLDPGLTSLPVTSDGEKVRPRPDSRVLRYGDHGCWLANVPHPAGVHSADTWPHRQERQLPGAHL